MYIYLIFIISIILLYLYIKYDREYFSDYNREEDYKFHNVDELELKRCGIIKEDNKIKNNFFIIVLKFD